MCAQSTRMYLPASMGYTMPGNSGANSITDDGGLSTYLGYQWSPYRNWAFGAQGSWLWSGSMYQIAITAEWRAFKHDWTPYFRIESGIAWRESDSLSAVEESKLRAEGVVRGIVGAQVGVYIPLVTDLDLDIGGGVCTMVSGIGTTLFTARLGVRYQLPN